MEAKDYVGWTVVVHEGLGDCVPGVYYCTGRVYKDWPPEHLQLAKHGELRDANESEALYVNFWMNPEDCTRLRQGDFAP